MYTCTTVTSSTSSHVVVVLLVLVPERSAALAVPVTEFESELFQLEEPGPASEPLFLDKKD